MGLRRTLTTAARPVTAVLMTECTYAVQVAVGYVPGTLHLPEAIAEAAAQWQHVGMITQVNL
jgi:hypothetical protein